MKSYLINLDRSPERLEFFRGQAAAAGVKFERLPAVDGKSLPSGELAARISPDFQFQPLMATEAAVFLSHRLCWQRLVESGDALAAIFEDDACLAPVTGALLAALETMEIDSDIIRLETTGRRIVLGPEMARPVTGTALHRLLTWHGGTAGYVLSRQAAVNLLEKTDLLTDPVDQLLFHPHSALAQTLVILQANPAPVMQHDLLHPGVGTSPLASTTGRTAKPFSLWRHGPLIDLRRMWIKHRERALRNRLRQVNGNIAVKVPFAGLKNSDNSSSNIVEIAISGGLGNQMFQYAAARALALSTDADLRLDIGFFDKKRHRDFELDALPIKAEIAARDTSKRRGSKLENIRLTPYQEPHFHPDPAFASLVPPVRLQGYFQSPAYFDHHAEIIRSELMPAPATDAESVDVAEQMARSNGASLHIRRGDYVDSPKITSLFVTCPISYYEAAMQRLPQDATVFVFSDDIAWAKQNLPSVRPLVFVGQHGPRSGMADLWLMTRARHHIIANSSFSWWGAWLGKGGGITIAPSRWFHDPSVDDRALIPPDWLRLEA